MDMNQPPAIIAPSGVVSSIRVVPAGGPVLMITNDGKKLRGSRELKDLTHDELLVVIDELVDLIRHR